ncbi:MAG: TonB family protein [Gammaproteobacteria bacterium]
MNMRRAMILGAVGILAVVVSATCFAGPGSVTILPNGNTGDVYPIKTVAANLPPGALHAGAQMCATYLLTVDADGTTKNVRIWSQFPRDATQFARAGQAAMKKWKYHAHHVDGKPVATDNVSMVMSYQVSYAESNQDENSSLGSHISNHHTERVSDEQTTLRWLCSQPPLHGVSIVASGTASAAQSASSERGGIVANPVTRIPADSLPAGARPGKVRIRFCVDEKGRVADTMVVKSSPHGVYDEAALRALAATQFTTRKIKGSATASCGLVVLAKFSGGSRGEVGRLEHMTFGDLSGASPVPKLVAQKSVPISLHIPAGTPLPKVAKVEVRMCIEKNGAVSQASVVQADPPDYFDQAALQTVAGWRFASPPRRMCDVYQSVQFPLGGGGQ